MIGKIFTLHGLKFEVTSREGDLYAICTDQNLELFIKKQILKDAIQMGDAIPEIEQAEHDGSRPDPRKGDLHAEYLAALADPKS